MEMILPTEPVMIATQDGVPDECGYSPGQPDCNQDGIPDICELDCNFDGVPDSCQTALDCDLDGVLDSCELLEGTDSDCKLQRLPGLLRSPPRESPLIVTETEF